MLPVFGLAIVTDDATAAGAADLFTGKAYWAAT
jgi:hypothetical protein